MTAGKISGPRPEHAATQPSTRDVARRLLVFVPDEAVADAAAILRTEFVTRRDMKVLGIDVSAQTLRVWERAGGFPQRSYLTRTRPVWPTRAIANWLLERLHPTGIAPAVGGGKRPKWSYKKKGAADVTTAK
ncbi:MAG: hypothetical protein ING19_01425 [Azospirillum sp.]|nr:hypothetical protein [Azospirillum sp.]MCA3264702.1 hypothetical protein [Azospirillum sp.]